MLYNILLLKKPLLFLKVYKQPRGTVNTIDKLMHCPTVLPFLSILQIQNTQLLIKHQIWNTETSFPVFHKPTDSFGGIAI